MLEAWPGKGVHERPFWSDTTGIDFFRVPHLRDTLPLEFAGVLRVYLGRRYDYIGVLRFLLRRKRRAGAKSRFCSELLFEAARSCGCPLLRGVEPVQVSPGLLSYSPKLIPMTLADVRRTVRV